MNKRIALLAGLALTLGVPAVPAASAHAVAGHSYYVSPAGNDANSGTSPSAPWQTLARVNLASLSGATIHLEGGQVFYGCLSFGAGQSDDTVDSYGAGRASINCSTAAGSGVSIHDTGGISLTNLDIVNDGGPGGGYYGVEMSNDISGGVKKSHFRFDRLEISGFSVAGIAFHAEPGDGNPATGFSDIRITNVKAHDNRDAGIESWSNRSYATGSSSYNFDSVYIGSSATYDNPGIPHKGNNSGNGIVIGEASNVTIEHSVAYGNGTSNNHIGGGPVGIWVYETKHAVIQYNESYDNSRGTGDSDGGGFDLDGGVSDSVVQYNCSHGNDGAAVLVFQYDGGREHTDNVIRGNVSVNDARKGNYGAISTGSSWAGHPASNVQIYGNVISMNATTADPAAVQSGLRFWDGGNNISVHGNVITTSGNAVRLVSEEHDNPGLVLDRDVYSVPRGTTPLFVWNGGYPQYTEGGATTYSSFAAFRAGTGQEKHGTFLG